MIYQVDASWIEPFPFFGDDKTGQECWPLALKTLVVTFNQMTYALLIVMLNINNN